jgi:gamma-glutamyltranspeptidase / glutathione hydrolase
MLRIFAIAFLLPLAAPAQERSQARSMTISVSGIAATSQTLASQSAAQILARGGSAVDAAIAANAVLSVVEPMMCGIGGDLFAIHYDAQAKKLSGFNGSGWSGRNQTLDTIKAKGLYALPTSGIHTATVPGAVDAWWQLHQKFGKLPWRDLFQPAIFYARNGYPVTEIIAGDWAGTAYKLRADPNAAKFWLPNGAAPETGQIFKIPQLAQAYELLAAQGRDAFYKGPIAQSILKTSRRLGGTLESADFAEFSGQWVDPVFTTYRGWRVWEMPPNGQGIAALIMLNLMEHFEFPPDSQRTARSIHLKIEAQKLAYQDAYAYIADPKITNVPTAALIAKPYAASRAASIDPEKANCDTRPGAPEKSSHTVYLSVADRQGNVVSWIQSVSDLWGSGVAVDDFAFHLHDRANGFASSPTHPNSLGPRKRPFHTIIPAFMAKDDQLIAFGIMRGSNQALAHAQFVSNVADHGMNIQEALEAPRFTRSSASGCGVLIESRLPSEEFDKLREMGHYVDIRAEYSGLMGGGQAILRNTTTKVNFGASSPRKDGAAIPEPENFFPNPKP